MAQAGVFSMYYSSSSIKICLSPKFDHLHCVKSSKNLKLKMSSRALQEKKKNLKKKKIFKIGNQVMPVKMYILCYQKPKVSSKESP